MSRRRIVYVGMYDYPDDVVNRFYSLAAINKMYYIISLLNENGYDVDIYSLSNSKESTFKFSREKKVEIGRNILYLTPTLGTSCKIGKALRIILSYCWLMMKILCNARTNDYILIYHTLEGIVPLSIVKRLKKLRYVLEVEEIYSEMPNSNGSNKKKELRFISRADKYIVVSHLLKDKLPPRDSMIIYGNYKFVDDANSYIKKNNKINLLFSGSLDLTRGVFQAIESMYFLPENYVLNISGVGSKSSVYLVQKKIDELNTFRNKVVCRYLGKLDDNDYRLLLSSSDLALNTQIEGEYAQFLFPSKLLSYMAYNIPIVSTKGQSIMKSPFAKYIYFTNDSSGESIAKIVSSIDLSSSVNYQVILDELHNQAIQELKKILS